MTEHRVELPRPTTTAIPSSAEVASDYIRTLVFTGVLRTGDKVPIDDIATMLGISRQPVREAVIELAHDGLVHTDGGDVQANTKETAVQTELVKWRNGHVAKQPVFQVEGCTAI